MRRSLALAAIAASALRAAPARGEPLDVSLTRLGVPSADVICAIAAPPCTPGATQYQQAADARQRFALLTTQLGLALDSCGDQRLTLDSRRHTQHAAGSHSLWLLPHRRRSRVGARVAGAG